MRYEKEFRDRCAARGLHDAELALAVATLEALEAEAASEGIALEEASLDLVEGHLAGLRSRGEADEAHIMAIARYFLIAGVDAVAIRLLAYLLPIGVLPAMAERLGKLEGAEMVARVMAGIALPPEGSPPEAYPAAAKAFTLALEAELGPERARRVLMWNVHGIPASAFEEERGHFLAAPSIDAWLADHHEREVAILARHAAEGSLWYEQRITPRVVDFVRSNPEMRGGRRSGDLIFTTKIPYDPDRFLGSSDPVERRRLACHCPFAASTIDAAGADVPALWCSCSAGYEKFMFDVVFGEDTDCEILESVIAGGERCRFAIRIPPSILVRAGARP
jgi:hypothetical protein